MSPAPDRRLLHGGRGAALPRREDPLCDSVRQKQERLIPYLGLESAAAGRRSSPLTQAVWGFAPLCWLHHRAYDTGRLELLPYPSRWGERRSRMRWFTSG